MCATQRYVVLLATVGVVYNRRLGGEWEGREEGRYSLLYQLCYDSMGERMPLLN